MGYLIKNNFKLMFRNTWSIIVLVLGPVLVTVVLSSAFTSLMKSYEGVNEFAVGYRVDKDVTQESMFQAEALESIKTAGEDAGILFQEYPEGEVKEFMEKNELAGFVEFSENSYILYKSADYEIEGITLEYFMDRVVQEGLDTALQVTKEQIALPMEKLDFMPAVSATDYYGIIEIAYFIWCGSLCATGVLSNEKKYGIVRRFQVSNISETKNYLGKYIPLNLTTMAGMGMATVITALLFDIHWGNPLLSILIGCAMILAGNALGLMLYNLTENLAITVIILFSIVWIAGFFGGSFETYMFSSMPDVLKQLSPIYHGNRALVELSCMGKSEYVTSSIGYSMLIATVCSIIAIVAGTIRKRGRA